MRNILSSKVEEYSVASMVSTILVHNMNNKLLEHKRTNVTLKFFFLNGYTVMLNYFLITRSANIKVFRWGLESYATIR